MAVFPSPVELNMSAFDPIAVFVLLFPAPTPIFIPFTNKSCVLEIVPTETVPVNVGEALITTLPVPVILFDTISLLPLVNKAFDAVALERIGAVVKEVVPVTVSVPPIEVFPDVVKVVNEAVVGVVFPIGVFCILPALMIPSILIEPVCVKLGVF